MKYNFSVDDIKRELINDRVVLVPADGTILKNKFYTPPGPFIHTLVIMGYDNATEEFITHDPGTTRGESCGYNYKIMMEAIRNNDTGLNEPIDEKIKVMIIICQIQ